MRKALSLTALLLTMTAAPASAVKVGIDYNPDIDYSKYRTFAWMDTGEVSLKDSQPLMDSRIKNAIELAMTQEGLIEDTENPDVLVTYYGEEKEKVSVNPTYYGYGYYGGYLNYGYPYGYAGIGLVNTTVTTYSVGTLVIDIVDAKDKKLLWRATASDTIPENPQKKARLIDKAIKKIVKQWNNIKNLEAKRKR